jgi:hypothetical protein
LLGVIGNREVALDASDSFAGSRTHRSHTVHQARDGSLGPELKFQRDALWFAEGLA